jgi:hypothetical protein
MVGPPPDKWSVAKKIDGLTSGEVQELLNDQADLGNTTVLFAPCRDGNFLFFGNYSNS